MNRSFLIMALVPHSGLGQALVTAASNPWVRDTTNRLVRTGAREVYRLAENTRRAVEMARRTRYNRRINRARGGRTVGKRMRAGVGVTRDNDRARLYRKRTMPRFRRRRWRRFNNRVHAVSEKTLGSRTSVFNNQIDIQDSGNRQLNLSIALYSLQNGTYAHLDDLNTIQAYENSGDPTAAAGNMVGGTSKLIFLSGVLDLTLRNSTFQTTEVGPPAVVTEKGRMEVDIYEISSKRRWRTETGTRLDLSSLFSEGFTDTKNIGGAGGGLTVESNGVTPFDASFSLSKYGVKIWKKTKYFIESGSTITYQIRDPKRHVFDKIYLSEVEGPNIPKVTKWLYIIAKVVPGLTVGTAVDQFTPRLDVGVTRKYLHKIRGVNEDRDRYDGSSQSLSNPA